MRNFNRCNGMTLISFVITIIILIVLAFVVTNGAKGILKLNNIDIALQISEIKENYEVYKIRAEGHSLNYDITTLQWDGEALPRNTAKVKNDIHEDDVEIILGRISDRLKNKLLIKDGILYFTNLTENEFTWVSDYDIPLYTKSLLDYTVGSIGDANIQVTVDDGRYITINGNSKSEKYFIKITDGLDYATSSNSSKKLETWVNTSPNITDKNLKLMHEVDVISGSVKGEQLNVVVRNKSNLAVLNCKLQNNIFNVVESCGIENVFSYIYIAPYVECNNLKIRPSVSHYEFVKDDDLVPLIPSTVQYNNLTCTILDKNTFLFNGNSQSVKSYIKFSEGFDIRSGSMSDNLWVTQGRVFLNKGDKIKMYASFHDKSTVDSKEVNIVLRYANNEIAAKIDLMTGEVEEEVVLTDNVTALYIYIRENSKFNNSKIDFYLETIE